MLNEILDALRRIVLANNLNFTTNQAGMIFTSGGILERPLAMCSLYLSRCFLLITAKMQKKYEN